MKKFYGKVGYTTTSETKPGVHTETIVERDITGDIIRVTSKVEDDSKVNQNIALSDQLSFVASPEITQNFKSIRYVIFGGTAWAVKSVSVDYPRLVLTLGGVYNVKRN